MELDKQTTQHFEIKEQAPHVEYQGSLENDVDPELEKRLVKKMDTRIVPFLFGLWLLAFIDRSNIGNAKIDGLATDLKLVKLQYNTALAIFYVPYIAVEVPSNWIMKYMRAGVYIPCLMIGWGVVGTLMGLVKNYAGLLAARFFLGLFEGGLLGGLVLYLSMFYKRHELLYRIGLFYTAAPLSGAVGGLLATGLASISKKGVPQWSWIFYIEGIITVIFGVITVFFLPNGPGSAWFFNQEERIAAVRRLEIDAGTSVAEDDTFTWLAVKRGVLNINTAMASLVFFCLITPIYSYSLFLPTILKALGWTSLKAQLFTVFPYLVAGVSVLTVAHLSDKMRMRGPFILLTAPLGIIGFALLLVSDSNQVKYAGTFLIGAGVFPGSPCVMAWLNNNLAPHYTRATGTALQLAIANLSAFVATFTYLPTDGPKFKTGHIINICSLSIGWTICLIGVLYNKWENAVREKGGRDHRIGNPQENGYRNPKFRMTL